MSYKVVISHWVHKEVIEYLETAGCQVVSNPTHESFSQDRLKQELRDADAFMAFMPDTVDRHMLAAAPRLKIISCALKGYDNFDVEACTRASVWLTVVPDRLTEPTAELTLALMLGLSRHVLPGDRHIRSGQFAGWRPRFYGTGIADSFVGIIGMGDVGQAIAARLAGFRAKLLYSDDRILPQHIANTLRIRRVSREILTQKSDFIILALPLNKLTQHLVDDTFLQQMKLGSYLINPCRGSVVDESAVAAALDEGRLAGYAADVFEMEDWARTDRPTTINNRLLQDHERTLFTPHLGSAVNSIRRDIAMEAAENIVTALRGEQPDNALNKITSGDDSRCSISATSKH